MISIGVPSTKTEALKETCWRERRDMCQVCKIEERREATMCFEKRRKKNGGEKKREEKTMYDNSMNI